MELLSSNQDLRWDIGLQKWKLFPDRSMFLEIGQCRKSTMHFIWHWWNRRISTIVSMKILQSFPSLHLIIFNLSNYFYSLASEMNICNDFSFWQTDVNRCVPGNFSEHEMEHYLYVPLCNRTIFQCFNEYQCPNTSNFEDCSQRENTYFCEISKSCIQKGI